MIVDSSALIALILGEPEGDRVRDRLGVAETVLIGAPTMLETEMVLSTRMGSRGRFALGRLLQEVPFSEVSFAQEHRMIATDAFLRFGKGRHPARLNLGDCMTYAVAKVARRPLLCVGDDFAKTDLELVLPA